MAEFQRVIKERKRMCDSYERCLDGCPLANAKVDEICSTWILENPALAEVTIMKWAAEHPIVTNRDKFKEVFGLDYLDPLPNGCIAWLTAEYKGDNHD